MRQRRTKIPKTPSVLTLRNNKGARPRATHTPRTTVPKVALAAVVTSEKKKKKRGLAA